MAAKKRAKRKTKAKLRELTDLIWTARKLARSTSSDNESAAKTFQQAIAFATENGWQPETDMCTAAYLEFADKVDEAIKVLQDTADAAGLKPKGLCWFLLGSCCQRKGEQDHAIECYEKAIAEDSYDTPGYAWHNMGAAFRNKGDLDLAIECYEKALAEASYNMPGKTWNSMGIVFDAKRDHAQAIRCYEKALAEDSYDTPGQVWNNMGIALDNKGDHDQAIKCYEKALAEDSYDTPGYAWNNMGNTFCNKGDHDRAIDCYKRALAEAGDDKFGSKDGRANWGLGNAFRSKGDYANARGCYERAIEAFTKSGEDDLGEYLQTLLDSVPTDAEKLSEDDEAVVEAATSAVIKGDADSPEQRMLEKVSKAKKDRYERYDKASESKKDNVIATLRGWSSTVPLVETDTQHCVGGGYFFKWQGYGLVIDPGHDFIANFHNAGFHFREVDAVCVTHNHGDHNQDLQPLDDLFYEMCRRRGSEYEYALIYDKDTAAAKELADSKHRCKLCYDFDRKQQHLEASIKIKKPKQLPFDISYFRARHTRDVPNAVGLRIQVDRDKEPPFVLGFSADTEYFDELCDSEHLGNCDLLIAHISQPDTEEYDKPDHRKRGHLGYRGTARLIEGCNAKLNVIGEFWAGLADLRIDLVQGLRKLTGKDNILPSSTSLEIDPRNLNIRCTSCGRLVPHNSINVAPAQAAFGPLSYICGRCSI